MPPPPLSLNDLAARLGHIQSIVRDLAKANGSASPLGDSLAEWIIEEIEVVRRELRTKKRP
jgi:hypothetical protein